MQLYHNQPGVESLWTIPDCGQVTVIDVTYDSIVPQLSIMLHALSIMLDRDQL